MTAVFIAATVVICAGGFGFAAWTWMQTNKDEQQRRSLHGNPNKKE